MGIVQSQSIKNTIITFFGFGIGAVNALFLYTQFLGKMHYGMVATLLSGANILMPFMAFGIHNTLIRFYSHCKSEKEREEFMTFMLVMPLFFIIPLLLLFYLFQDPISLFLLKENPELKPFLWLIPVVGVFMGYFEIFYAWVKVHMQSVFGNFISEVVVRLTIMLLLFSVYWNWISKDTFVYCLALAYFFQLLATMLYAFNVKMPVFRLVIPHNIKEIFGYSFFIIVSGGVAVMLVDFDKVMIPSYLKVSENALYSVAIFIATVIIVPSRAMTQIIYPITAKLMAENKHDELNDLYKKSAINLQVIGGFIMLGIFLNIDQIYLLIPGKYATGTLVVFLIGLSKFYDLILGNNNAIILNTKYYKTVLAFGFLLVFLMIGLNMIFIPLYGIVGAALATLISVIVYNTIKLLFVVKKMNLYPFTNNTLKSFAIIGIVFLAFYFWDFPFHPILNIGLKSILITVLYVYLNFKFQISEEVNNVIGTVLKKVKIRT